MGDAERIEVRKIYAGRAAVFGLFYGIAIGLISGLFIFILLISVGNQAIGGLNKATTLWGGQSFPQISVGEAFLVMIIIVLFSSIGMCVLSCVSAFIYNLIAKIGGPIHFGLIECIINIFEIIIR